MFIVGWIPHGVFSDSIEESPGPGPHDHTALKTVQLFAHSHPLRKLSARNRGWAIHWKKAGWVNWFHDISWSDSSRKFWNGFQKHILAEARLARYNWWYLFIDLFSNEICYGESRTDIFIIPQLGVVCPRSSQVQPQTTGFLHQNGSKMRWDAGRRPDHFFSHYPGLSKFSKKHVTKQDKGLQAAWNSVDFSQKWNMLAAVARCQDATHFPSLAIAYRLPGQSAGTVVGKGQHLLAFQDSGQKWETKLDSNFWYVVSMNSRQL